MKSEVLVTPRAEASPSSCSQQEHLFFLQIFLKLVIKLRGFGNATLAAICVPNPAEYVFYRRFVTVAVGGGASREKCFQKNAFIKERCPAKKKSAFQGGKKPQAQHFSCVHVVKFAQ